MKLSHFTQLCKVGRSYRLSVLLAPAARPPPPSAVGKVLQLLCALEDLAAMLAHANRTAAAAKRIVAWCDVNAVVL